MSGDAKAATERRYRELFAEQERSGLSLRAFARERGIPAGTLSFWKHKLRRRDATQACDEPNDQCTPRFLPVRVTPLSSVSAGPGAYELVLGGSCVLRLPRDFEVERVAALVKAVTAC